MPTIDLDKHAARRDTALCQWYAERPAFSIDTPISGVLYDICQDVFGFEVDYVPALPYDWYAYTDFARRQIMVLEAEPYQRRLSRYCQYGPNLDQHHAGTLGHEIGHVATPAHWRFAQERYLQLVGLSPGLPAAARRILQKREKFIEREAHVVGQLWLIPEWQLVRRPEYNRLKSCIDDCCDHRTGALYRDIVMPLSAHFGITPKNVGMTLLRYGLFSDFGQQHGQFQITLPGKLPSWTAAVEANPVPIPTGRARPSLVDRSSTAVSPPRPF
ncbi:MAG: hypothetical protein U0822_22140 [Anaerolineae bacterium]